jgi:hypothetical protein
MARIVYSALVQDIRGSIGGTTFQKNAYGYTVKKKPNIIKPNTPRQNRSKSYFGTCVRAWKELSDVNRQNWETYASTYPQYAKYNPSSQLSGFAVFVRQNVFCLIGGLAILVNPSGAQIVSVVLSYTVTLAAGVLTVHQTCSNQDEEWDILWFISRPLGTAQNFVGSKCKYLRLESSMDIDRAVTSSYTSLFGALPAVGDRVAIDVITFNRLNGQNIARQSFIVTVT